VLRWLIFALALAAAGCSGRSHAQEEGAYALAVDKLIRDDCQLATNPELLREAKLFANGNTVRIDYSLFDTKLVGSFLSDSEQFVVDGSQANLNARIAGKDCLLDLVTVHMDGEAPRDGASNRFIGQLSVKLEKRPSSPCDCQLWMAYTAELKP
jgi:hypothetical protein